MRVFLALRIAVALTFGLLLSACVFMGEIPSQAVVFKIRLPEKTAEEGFTLINRVVTEQGYRMGGERVVNGVTFAKYREGCAMSPECVREFQRRSTWREAEPRRSKNGSKIEYWLAARGDRPVTLPEVDVAIEETKGVVQARIVVLAGSFAAKFSSEQRLQVSALKTALDRHFGPSAVEVEFGRGPCGLLSTALECESPFRPEAAGQASTQ
jgi:hypothetical protein